MRYTELKVGDQEYKLRLSASETINVEKKIGGNVLDIFMKKEQIPTMAELLVTLHGSLQKFQHGITLADTYNIYDDYVDNGGAFEDLIEVIMDVLEVSGFFKKGQLEEGKAKLKKAKEKENE